MEWFEMMRFEENELWGGVLVVFRFIYCTLGDT